MKLLQLLSCAIFGISITSCGLQTSPAAAPAADRFGGSETNNDPRGPGANRNNGNQSINNNNNQGVNNNNNQGVNNNNNQGANNNNNQGVQGAGLCETLTSGAAMPATFASCSGCHGANFEIVPIESAGDYATALAALRAGVPGTIMPPVGEANMSDKDFAQVWVNASSALQTFNFPDGCTPTY